MYFRRIGLCAISATLLLGGCNQSSNRGIDPIIRSADVESSLTNQKRILTALAIDYDVVSNSEYWYNVSQAGFNFVDDECRLYFNNLFFLNREREQIKASLATASTTAAAILGVTGASTKSIAVVSQAFGLGIAATELVAGTYLYQTPPAAALGFVKELQLAYREGAATRRREINSPSSAYHAIQDYLSLCLPPTIETKIAEHIASARAAPDPLKRGAGSSFGLTVVSLPQVSRADIQSSIITNVDVPLSKPFSPAPVTKNRMGPYEPSMLKKDIQAIQKTLCLKVDGDLGSYDSDTRLKLLEITTALHETEPRVEPSRIIGSVTAWKFLQRYLAKAPACPSVP